MPRPNAFVDRVNNLSPHAAAHARPAAHLLRVDFEGGRVGHLDMSLPHSAAWAEILQSLQATKAPSYVEIDPSTNLITELRIPVTVGVGAITRMTKGDAVEVELIISHARHYLLRSNPDFDQFLKTLEEAQNDKTAVLVTETDKHEIIDVQPLPKPSPAAEMVAPPPAERLKAPAPISYQQAQNYFNLVANKTCCPATVPPPCIPFLYPDDGCWGRAHEMCRLMIEAGAQPQKVWSYGTLRVQTANNPACSVGWRWHVAPTLSVSTGAGPQDFVIDPALFNVPVTLATWKSVQGDPAAVLEPSDASVFYRGQGGTSVTYDPDYSQTQQVLTTYRFYLRLRAVGPDGPPPYPQCLTRPAGVQWFGTIAGNATQRWFTYGWPAAWHMIWTIMPMTPCVGAAQLTWKVQVERASDTQCTYWISVTNLTANTVTFEGRYDILKT